MRDTRTRTPAQAAAHERAHGPEWDRYEDADPTDREPFRTVRQPIDCGRCEQDGCLLCAWRRMYGGAS